ncbi:hypothetical protein B0O99DRAFT_114927 [Bisporella sp. PMI_857]|nr:hypothetical protein B0O99DRAFT_114927 [Bisporella sp. PMI_857]
MATCKVCSQELIIELDPEDFNEATSSAAGGSASSVPDDLLLSCGCHFHWQCLLDESRQIATSHTCPSCNMSITSASGQVLTRYHNEGGVQENLDIAPLITEEAYLDANPTARPARAYLTMCAEGDGAGIVELLQAIEEDSDEGDMSPSDILRYQDPLDSMKTGLHVAVEKQQKEIVWVLLWLGADIPEHAFPEEVIQAAQTMNAGRNATQGPDIRKFQDGQGRTAGDIALNMGDTWTSLLGAGFLIA